MNRSLTDTRRADAGNEGILHSREATVIGVDTGQTATLQTDFVAQKIHAAAENVAGST